ncbi:hypothetical protein [Cellulomonas dongxiuzhuiae]|uniref:HD domain-containing protein n=1 Tax=Cellulomonas dongxiuzhuiae TaxID=2819979 RepID=A0ABX8GFF0_9CELL|nr:hypothetical protein [Cellulomonas dongxiuzhuiae]MBO3093575.1 hypothetical protein [Cellulomonas dongxiuzhuiae]QWC14700.1 hypothetical protein KKR89_09950 [Cellulomonas dongxiuzhuiae]
MGLLVSDRLAGGAALSYVGSDAWCRSTAGVLRPRDKAELVRLAAVLAVSQLPGYALYRLRVPPVRPRGTFQFAEPDGVAARTARSQLAAIAEPYLVNHSLRTYLLSKFIGERTDREFDCELLYVASLAHDVGILDAGTTATGDAPCFSIRSADWATAIARSAGWEESRITRLRDAITLNLNGMVARRQGVEAHHLMRGVLVDVVGFYAWRVPRTALAGLYERFPLLDQRPELSSAFVVEGDRHPLCRAHFSIACGFGFWMRHAPQPPPPHDSPGGVEVSRRSGD